MIFLRYAQGKNEINQEKGKTKNEEERSLGIDMERKFSTKPQNYVFDICPGGSEKRQ